MISPIIKLDKTSNQSSKNSQKDDDLTKEANLENEIKQKLMQSVRQKVAENEGVTDEKQVATQEQKKKEELESLNKNINDIQNEIDKVFFKFERSEDNPKDLILKIIDQETREVLQQYPSELSLKIAKIVEELLGTGQIIDDVI